MPVDDVESLAGPFLRHEGGPVTLRPLEAGFETPHSHVRLAASVRARATSGAVICVSAALSTAAVIASLEADAPAGERVRDALLNALIILLPVGVGLSGEAPGTRRFGRLLIAAGLVWSTAALANADASVPCRVGRIGGGC